MNIGNVNPRRRGAAFVTSNACQECRQKRKKCDGHNPCARCAALGNLTCRYEVSVQASKASLRAEISELRSYRQSSEHIFGLLASNEQRDYILGELQSGQSLRDISQGLDQQKLSSDSSTPVSGTRKSGTDVLVEEMSSTIESAVQQSSPPSGSQHIGEGAGIDDSIQGGEPWTEMTTDTALIDHLISLYFCWEYSIFATLSRQHFIADYKSGRRRYCSSLLINAVLAIGYQLSSGAARTSEGILSANHFFKEAERLLEHDQSIPSVTTIQALGLMSIFEASQGRSEQSVFYSGQAIRMVVEMGLHDDVGAVRLPVAEREVRRATAWGAYALDHTWSLILGSIPHLSLEGFRAARPSSFEVEEKFEWVPYTGDVDTYDNTLQQEGNAYLIYSALCGLFEVVHSSLYVLYAPRKVLGRRDILEVYTRYLTWHDSLPPAVRRGQNSTPSVFFIHIYYNFTVLLLFGPFIKLRVLDSKLIPLELCVQAARTITSLLHSYGELYSLRRTPCFMPILTVASNIMHAVQAEIQGTPNLQLNPGISILLEMTFCHKFARRGIKYLNVVEQRTSLVVEMQSKESPYQFVRCAISFIEAGIEDLPTSQADPFCTSIYGPFPGQVLPVASFVRDLQEAGFELAHADTKGGGR